MKILALEFSSQERSVAVLDLSSTPAVGRCGQAREFGARGVRGLSLVEEALRGAGMEREEIECVAVGLGPGSYTGVRSAISLAQGWQLARGIQTVGVGAIECLAEQAFQSGLRGRLNVIIDAQRGEFHLASATLGPSGWSIDQPLHLVARCDVQARLDAGEQVIGPEATRWFPSAASVLPCAMIVATLASRTTDRVPGEKLEPITLREINYVKAPPPRILPAG